MKKSLIALVAILTFVKADTFAQCYVDSKGNKVGLTGGPCVNTVVSSVPFLRIAPDARSGAMGDAGIAITPDANALHFNASNLAFSSEDLGVSATYTPWLSALGIQDIYLAYAGAFKKLNKRQTIGASIKYFSLGEIAYTDENGAPTGTGSPNELETGLTFVQQLSPKFSAAVTGKFIYSNLAAGQAVSGGSIPIKSGKAGAADISFTYKTPIRTANGKNDLTVGLALTNIGSKISYTSSVYRDYLPANMGLGVSYKMKINDFNSVLFAVDINKLMVPTPVSKTMVDGTLNPEFDKNNNKVPDYKEKSLVSSITSSFADAPASEELKEFTYSLGAEYWYDNQFAVRAGYFHEDKLKGGRRYATIGLGLKYNIFGLNFSYLVPTSAQRTPLDNTLRFSLLFDFGAFKADEE